MVFFMRESGPPSRKRLGINGHGQGKEKRVDLGGERGHLSWSSNFQFCTVSYDIPFSSKHYFSFSSALQLTLSYHNHTTIQHNHTSPLQDLTVPSFVSTDNPPQPRLGGCHLPLSASILSITVTLPTTSLHYRRPTLGPGRYIQR